MAKPNGGIVGQSIIPGTGQLFGVYSATTAAGLTSAGLYSVSSGNIATKTLAVADPVITALVYTGSTFANVEGAVATTANALGNIRIFGTNFVAGSTVYIAGQASAYTNVVSINEIQARVPSLSAGTYDKLMVFSPAGSGILSNLNITTVNAPTFTTASVFSFVANTAFSTSITAIGATNGYRISDGSLPANVTFDTSTGALSGNVAVNSLSAVWNFDVTAIGTSANTVQNHYLVFNSLLPVSYLVVGAGGGAGPFAAPAANQFGHGGAGGMITGNTTLDTTQTYQVGVGSATSLQQNGTDSWINCPSGPGFGNIAAYGGGCGGTPASPTNLGRPGGSGGGNGNPAVATTAGGTGLGGTAPGQPGATIYGNPGGTTSPFGGITGGGGARSPGTAGAGAPAPGQAGLGVYHSITGANVLYARGGGDNNLNVPGSRENIITSDPASWVPLLAPGTGFGATTEVPSLYTQPGTWTGIPARPGVVVLSYSSPSQQATGGTVTTYTSGSNKYYVHKFINNTVASSTFVAGATAGLPVWANANVAFYANYYNATVSTQLRAYNASTYTVATGNTLPTGLSLATTGLLSGTVTAESAGFYVNATSSTSLVSSQQFSLAYSYPIPAWVTSATLPGVNNGSAYSRQLSATIPAGLGSVVYSLSAGNTLPTGISLSSSGLLSGTPTVSTNTTYTFYVRAAHNIGSAFYTEQQFSLTVSFTYQVEYLVLAGGGGGGSGGPNGTVPTTNSGGSVGAGGGAGGYLASSVYLLPGSTYTISIGAGGAGGRYGPSPTGLQATAGNIGFSSNIISPAPGFSTISASGGGGGGYVTTYTVPLSQPWAPQPGLPGGSGGGGAGAMAAAPNTPAMPQALNQAPGGLAIGSPGIGVAGTQGWPGSPGGQDAPYVGLPSPATTKQQGAGGSGGGAGGAGTINISYNSPAAQGVGGPGLAWTFDGILRGGGGGGSSGGNPLISGISAGYNGGGPNGGSGGGGSGGYVGGGLPVGTSGAVNSGGGGGGNTFTQPGLAGGSGVVVLAIPTPNYSGSRTGSNVTVSNPPAAPGMTVITFNSSGTYTA